MKKWFKKVGITILTSAILMLSACNNGTVDYKGAGYTDQQITLGTPSVNGKTYPGVNYIYWDRVANAINGYTLSIYEDGVLTNTTPITLAENVTWYVDTDVKYNVAKTYKVRAIGDSAGRYVIYTESDAGSITLNPIVPPTDTSALDLAKYEKGYKEDAETPYELTEDDAVWQLSKDTIKVAKDEAQGTFTVTFPAKAYLTYTIYADYGKTYELTGTHEYSVGTYQDFAVNNKNVTVSGVATVAGTYNITVKAAAVNKNYFKSSGDVKVDDALTYNTLALSSKYTATNTAYAYESETRVGITWQPAIYANGTYARATDYKIYKSVAGLTDYELVTSEISLATPISSNVPTYKITDTTDGASYVYLFVITDGTNFANICTSCTIASYKEVISALTNSGITASYTDEYTIHLQWTPAAKADGSLIEESAYKVYRKVAGEKDSAYVEVGTVESTTTLFGSTTYFINDEPPSNSVDYVYAVVYTNGTAKTTATATVSAYKIIYKNTNFDVNLYYTADDTIRIKWYPATVNGEMLDTDAYAVYRREYYGSTDTDYELISESIRSSKDQENKTVYYVDTEVDNNTIAYYYTVRYRNGNTINYTTKSIDAYSLAPVYSVPTATLIAADDDNIYNDVHITLTVSNEQSLESIKYLIRDTNVVTNLLAADYTEELLTDDAVTTEDENGIAYEWTLSDLEEGSYVSVAAIVDGNAKYATTTAVSETAPRTSVDTTNSTVSITWKDADNDGIANDAYVLVTLADDDKILSSVTYGLAATSNEAAEIAIEGSNSLTVSGTYKVYAFSIPDAATETGSVLYVRATISENGKKDSYITKDSAYNLSEADSFTLAENPINIVEADNDGMFNDISFDISASNSETFFDIICAVSDTAATATKLLDSSEARTVVRGLSGYKFYELTADKYSELKDIDLGMFVAIRITASQDNRTDTVLSKVSTAATYDAYAADRTAAPTASKASFMALDDDRIANDFYATIELYNNQTISELYYTKATKAEYTANDKILNDRLNSSKVTYVSEDEYAEKYRTDEKIIYEVTLKDFNVDDYVALRYVLSEDDKLDYTSQLSAGPVSASAIALETTAAVTLSQANIFFTSYDADANYNDIKDDSIYVSLDVNQTIKSIRYAYAASKDEINKLLRTDSTADETEDISIPDNYELTTSVTGTTATLTKIYTINPDIRDIPDGNMVGIKFVISEPGFEDYVRTIYTDKTNYYFNSPVEETITTGALAAQKPVHEAKLTVSDEKNWEYVHVIVKDWFYKDDVTRYTYKLERTFENQYNEPDTVWETVEENISLAYNPNNDFYTFDKYYTDKDNVLVGTYVYRLTKTRKAESSVTGEEEAVITDARVSVVYHVDLDTLSFSDYSSEKLTLNLTEYMNPDYDDITKYNYIIEYYVEYFDEYGDYIECDYDNYSYGSDSWTELTNWTWKKERDDNSEPTGYYTLKDAVISGINSNDPEVKSARVYAQIIKERKIAQEENDYAETNILLNWGITASIEPSSSVSLSAPVTTTVDGITYIVVEADADYDSYTWYLDGETIPDETTNKVLIREDSLSSGSHEIIVVAKDGSVPYSATVSYSK